MMGWASLQCLNQLIALADTGHKTDHESAALKNPAQLKVGPGAVHGVNAPVNRLELLANCVPPSERRERRQGTFASAINVSKFHDERSSFNPEAPKQIC